MKYSSIVFLLFAISCGKYEVTTGSSQTVGESRSTSAISQVSNVDRTNLTSVCNALGVIETVLPTAVNSNLLFAASQSDCSGVSSSGNQEVVIISSGQSFVFKKKLDNQDFIFPTIETRSSGVISPICTSINNLQNPLVSGGSATYFTTSGIDPADCTPASGEICVQVERATQSGDAFIVHTKEWLRVRVSSPSNDKIGFVTDHKKVTKGFCGENESLSFRATLK